MNIFDDSKLALDIFTLLEASRIDRKVLNVYRGIRDDYLDVQNIHHGGRIMPGIQMRYDSLNHFTSKI